MKKSTLFIIQKEDTLLFILDAKKSEWHVSSWSQTHKIKIIFHIWIEIQLFSVVEIPLKHPSLQDKKI